jgi:hypothetical protein
MAMYMCRRHGDFNALIYGDVVAAGGTVVINDSVAVDVLMLGGRVTINGAIGDDVRCAGGTVVILAVLATAITAIIAANWINRVYNGSEWSVTRIVFVAFGIFVLLKLMTLTPVIGPLLMVIMICLAFGSILISLRKGAAQTRRQQATN